MPPSRPPNFTSALKPLRLEMQRGCRDDAVIGGFGRFVRQWAAKTARGAPPEPARSLERLGAAFGDYETLRPEQRRELCEKAVRALELYQRRYGTSADGGPVTTASPVTALRGVGPRRAEAFAQLGIHTVGDLLAHFPTRHDDRRNCPPVASLAHRQSATVPVTVTGKGWVRRISGHQIGQVPASDGTTDVVLSWFGGPYRAEQYEPGTALVVTGQVMIRKGEFGITVAEVEVLPGPEVERSLCMGRLTPTYPLVKGLSQVFLRRLVWCALEACAELPRSAVPEETAEARGLSALGDAVREMHFPADENALRAARERIAYEELFVLQAALAQRRGALQRAIGRAALPVGGLLEEFRVHLPFSLTGAQERVIGEMAGDLEAPAPAGRLIHGDVGSGKTVCAAFALLAAARQGRQAALMAPTELLARQHHRVVEELLGPLGVQCLLLLGGMGEAARRAARGQIAGGEAAVVIGTHALFQEGVRFGDLAVAIIDEQHRFGVRQRAELAAKGDSPNVFVMSATPIPRTLALTAYGDMDVSALDELPPGRKPVTTVLAWGKERYTAYETVAHRVAEGRQAYIVCPLVEGGEESRLAAAEREFARLRMGPLAAFRLGLVHGRLPAAERDETMERFRRGDVEILVTTTVVEVGVDVPNATVMLVENAERFGPAQLHQLRGRIARGEHEGICILLTRARSPDVIERLQVLERTSDGFEIAEEDLRRRGPGEMTGLRQSGLPDLRLADLVGDTRLLSRAREDAFALLEADPRLERPEHAALKEALRRMADDAGPWAF